jgi:hypothetical protein
MQLVFPSDKYKVIYADPPWRYKDKITCGKRGAEFKYPTVTNPALKRRGLAFPIANR